MSLCRVVPILTGACTALGGLVGWFCGGHVFLGAAAGFGLIMLPFSVLMTLIGLLLFVLSLWRPDEPRCTCGLRRYDYVKTVEPDDQVPDTVQYEYRCACGRRYVLRNSQFQRVDIGGIRRPYMIHSAWGRWRRAT